MMTDISDRLDKYHERNMHDIAGFMIRIENMGNELQRLVRLKQSLDNNKKLTNREKQFLYYAAGFGHCAKIAMTIPNESEIEKYLAEFRNETRAK